MPNADTTAAPRAHTAPRTWCRHSAGRWATGSLCAVAAVTACSLLAGCGLHVSKHGVSGNILGHSFAASQGSLPAGFPSDVPRPDASRVLGGAGADNSWDAAFAVTGSIGSGTLAYAAKLRSSGYTISNVRSAATPATNPSDTGSTGSTVTLSGAMFEARNGQWSVDVESGTTSSVAGTGLRSGEFAINVVVTPASTAETPST
jgi:hypothetical protein